MILNSITRKLTTSGFPQRHSEFRPVDSKCEEWAERYERLKPIVLGGGILFFIGKRGTGKTQIATTLSGYALTNKKRVKYLKAYEVFEGLMGRYEKDNNYRGFIKDIIKVDILIIDALEVRKGSEFENRELNYIIDKRYDNPNATTILIANDTADSLKAFLGVSVFSRTEEVGGVITFNGRSFRKKEV